MHPLSTVQPIYYRPQTKLWKGNVLTSVCQSFCSKGGCLPQCMLGYTPPWQTPPWADNPPCPVHVGIHSAQCILECILVSEKFTPYKSQVGIDLSSIIEKNCFVYEVYSWFSAGRQDFGFQIIFSTAICP